MASKTPFLDLYKKDPVADRANTFNITTMLNDNWDKIDTKVKAIDTDKVDKIVNKGLSTNDFTTVLKNKLDGIEPGANKYTHPEKHPPAIIEQDTNNRFVSDTEKSDWNSKETTTGSQAKVNTHEAKKTNPHNVTKDQVGLANVDNVKQASATDLATTNTNLSNLQDEVTTHLAENATLENRGHVQLGTYNITLGTTWSGTSAPYTQTVGVSGILSTDSPIISPRYSTINTTAVSQKEAWGVVSKATTSTDVITFTCFEDKPTRSIPLQVKVVR